MIYPIIRIWYSIQLINTQLYFCRQTHKKFKHQKKNFEGRPVAVLHPLRCTVYSRPLTGDSRTRTRCGSNHIPKTFTINTMGVLWSIRSRCRTERLVEWGSNVSPAIRLRNNFKLCNLYASDARFPTYCRTPFCRLIISYGFSFWVGLLNVGASFGVLGNGH